jgi:hypothetical protein
MTEFEITHLRNCIKRYGPTIPALADVGDQLRSLPLSTDSPAVANELDTLIERYEQCYPLLEQAMWSSASDFDALLDCYQSLCREQEVLTQQKPRDDRHHFILSIPVADRPPHLQACLESILQLCEKFGYGGNTSGVYDKIKVIVAEDSRDKNNIRRHIELVDKYRQQGLQVFHFDQPEQYELLRSLAPHQREQLGKLLTTQPREKFYLKGQAANRNLSYLKCLQLAEDKHTTLYYMVDSDQSFCVNRQTEAGEEMAYALNYFHAVDKVFRSTDTLMLTGKLVGDPPVSPAVMAANFIDDVTAFFTRLAETRGDEACSFHQLPEQLPGDAAYHDMASLFGFEHGDTTFPYRCRLEGQHDHEACLKELARRLNAFFFGEHLTRKTYFSYGNGFEALTPARTIYPGNYIVNYEGLKYVIPFGHLRLRMSGPTAGRLIAAEIEQRFASINLPHLHRRTNEAGSGDDFRPGVEQEQEHIDLSNEFERQFFGDLMLFTTEALVKQADVNRPFEEDLVVTVLDQKEKELTELYQQKHDAILEKNRRLNDFVFNSSHWWMEAPGLSDALKQVSTFISNINHNFGEQSQAWHQIQSVQHRAERKQQIVEALLDYRAERDAWDRLFP